MKEQRSGLIVAFVVLSLVCLCMYNFQGIYSFTLYPDEFGYWANAAKILGYDFSEVASIGSYYSYGYSLILTPIMFLFKDSIIAYRAAVIVNLLFQIASFFVIRMILDKFLNKSERSLKYLLSGIAVLYPSWVFYTQMTMSESLLFFMYVLTALFMIRFIDKPSLTGAVLLSVSALYMYAVHMRTVGVLAAVFISVVIELFLSCKRNNAAKRKEYILVLIMLILGFVFCLCLKNYVADALYGNGQMSKVDINDYSGQTGKLIELLSPMGIGRFLVSMAGKVLYLGCASFGLAYIGVYALVKRVQKGDRRAFYLLLSPFLEFMVMCVYLLHSADLDATRFDLFLHGRYFDFAIPLLGIIGFYELLQNESVLKTLLISLGIVLLTGIIAIIVTVMNRTGMSDPHAALMIGMSYFLDEEDFHPVAVIVFSVLATLVIAIVLFLLIKFYKKSKNAYLMFLVHVLLIILSFHACSHFIYSSQGYIYGDVLIANEIKKLRKEGHDGDIVLLYEGGFEYIDTIQIRLRDEHIHVKYLNDKNKITSDAELTVMRTSLESMISDEELILVDFESPFRGMLSEIYDESREAGHFVLYYNVGRRR